MCCAFGHSPLQNPQQFLPRELPWSGASEAVVVTSDHPWITPGEKTGLVDSPSYDDTIAYLKRLCAEVPIFSLHEFGRTAQGRILYVVVATKERWHTPEALSGGRKPTLLAQCGIHSGEIEGKDAGLMLLRDIAFGGKSHLLDAANVLFIPVLNADGHERSSEWTRPNQRGPLHMGWRTTAQNLNLNRDFVKADAPEMRALLGLLDRWQPSLYLDLHVTDGIDYQYDVTYTFSGVRGSYAYSPQGGAWLDQVLSPALDAALKAHGHCPLNVYIDPANGRDLDAGLIEGHALPRFSQGYGDARAIPTVLIETHSLKSHRQRVLGVYVLLESALSLLGQKGPELRAAIAADRAARPASLPTGWTKGPPTQSLDFLGVAYEHYRSPASGAMEVRWTGELQTFPALPLFGDQPKAMMSRPKAYWVPISKPDVIDRLRLHGITCETLTSEQTVELEFHRLVNAKPRLADGFHPFEGRHTLSYETAIEQRREKFPMGSVRVSTDQPLGILATIMLQPESEDSLLAWGFFSEVLQRTEYIEGYVCAPMGEHLLQSDPGLKSEFDARIAADPVFANDPKARLSWFYERSPFFDDRYLLYPVGIER